VTVRSAAHSIETVSARTSVSSLVGPKLTRRRAVDFCRVATALCPAVPNPTALCQPARRPTAPCRAANGSQPVAPESCGAAY
jgi:hypothetical protein